MSRRALSLTFIAVVVLWNRSAALRADEPGLPAAAPGKIDFESQIKPILQSRCLSCHGRGKYKGGLSLETREAILEGGEDGPAAVVGKGEESLLVRLSAGLEEERKMPQKGPALTAEQVGLLRAWVDQGLPWSSGFSFGFRRAPVTPRKPAVPPAPPGLALPNPVDRFVAQAFATQDKAVSWETVPDRVYARRIYLDVIGLLPTPDQLATFEKETRLDKRDRLAAMLLNDRDGYAEHWLSFWNDALRNAYRGTGFIDGGRRTITAWLFQALYDNKPYDKFVRELVSPKPGSGAEGFTKGIIWRGVVNASQAPPVQAAQNLGQVFLGANLKCASCHDSFVNYWKLADAYALASVFAEKPLEIHRCDKPTGKISTIGFVYPELGDVDDQAPRAVRVAQLAELLVKPENGRFARTIVNRLWASLMGRGIVEPLDDMDQEPWSQDLLDWLASDFVAHGHDLKHTLGRIITSRAYQLPSVDAPAPDDSARYAFHGPYVKRMSAEQFADALSAFSGVWPKPSPDMLAVDGRGQGGQLAEARAVFAKSAKAGPPRVEARWVWSHEKAASDAGGTILLRKVVPLKKVPGRVVAVATCDNELVLHINGKRVGQSAEWTKPVSMDVTKWLRPGDNVIAVEATNWPDPEHKKGLQTKGANPAGLLAWIGGFDGNEQVWGVGTDASWLWSKSAKGEWMKPGFDTSGWRHAAELAGAEALYGKIDLAAAAGRAGEPSDGLVRAALEFDDPLLAAMGRTNREQVVTRRDSIATTLQALEFINGATLDARLKSGAARYLQRFGSRPDPLIHQLFLTGLGREPTPRELTPARDLVGDPATSEGVQDLLWAVLMLPEFQLID